MILWTIAIFGGLLLLAHWVSTLMVMRRLRRAPEAAEPAAGWPRITLLRPVCGLDPQDRQTFASSFSQTYPDWELIFCVAHPDDPAIPVLRELIAAHPQVPTQLLIGETRLTGNPKLNNLLKGWDAATGSFVAMSDCNVLLPPDYLRQLAARWRPDTGLVSAPPLATQPSGLWAAVEAAFLNGNQARLQLAADCLGAGFAQGKTLMWRKADLDAVGGLPALARDLAEDVACTKVAHTMGRKVHLTTRPFPQPIGQRSAGAVWARQLRWSKVRRAGFPGMFLLEPLNGPLIPFAALALPVLSGAAPAYALIALPVLWYLPEWALARAGGWRFGGIDLCASVIRDALLPALWCASLGRQGFDWRGTAMAASEARNDAMPTV
jgi:ceramide glucosyltransferase